VIKNPATRFVAAVIFFGGIATAPLLDNSDPPDIAPDDVRLGEPLSAQLPRFEIQWLRGSLTLSGHTASLKHEQDLMQVADFSYPDTRVMTDFQPLGIVPAYWAEITAQALYLLAETASAKASLSPEELEITGVIVDELGWQSRFSAVKKNLPTEISIDVDALIVDGSISVKEMCDRAFATLESGPINFEESNAEFRNSAYPRLERVIALAIACDDASIRITGHTDSSGTENWNQRLSLKRAQAVGDYLVSGGVDRERLDIVGAGSTAPVADNATRYGRSLNRRIEIALSSD